VPYQRPLGEVSRGLRLGGEYSQGVTGRSLILWVSVPFLALCALALWLTRPAPEPVRPEPRAQAPAIAPPPPPAPQAAVPPPPPEPEPRRRDSTLPSLSPRPITVDIPEAEPQEQARTGTVEKEEIRLAITTVVPLIRQCFLDIAERYPGTQSVTLKFTLEGQGLTGHFRDGEVVQSTIQDPFALACFLDSLLDVRFPPPREGGRVTLTYPFRFEPKPGAGR
jgi:hypothetical protein